MFAPAYGFPLHTNLGPGCPLQSRRKPYEFNYAVGAYRTNSAGPALERLDHLCADAGDRGRVRHLVISGGPGGPDARSRQCAGEEARAIKEATHLVPFEKKRFEFFGEILKFRRE